MLEIANETLELLEWPRLCAHLASFASTAMGKRLAQTWQPQARLSAAHALLDQTKEALLLDQRVTVSLQGIGDLEAELKHASLGGALSGESLLQIAVLLNSARKLRRLVDDYDDLPGLLDLLSTMRTYPELEQQIHHCIDDHGDVTDRASDKLSEWRRAYRATRSEIQAKLQRLMTLHSNSIQEAVLTQRDERYVIPVKATHRDNLPGLVHDSSASGATLYVEPNSVVPMHNQLRQLQGQIRREEERVLRELSGAVAAVGTDIQHVLAVITEFDLAMTRARYGVWCGGQPPILDADTVYLRQVRHPLLLQQQLEVVPVDLTVPTATRVVVITGPNTGGKTVALKTLGLMVLMAQAGLFLPTKAEPRLPWFDGIFADIGDEQSLEQSLSTFSGHVRRIGRILTAMTPQSLVLLDELGAGTDPTEGSALAAALLEHLGQTARLAIATTHYGELKTLKYQYDHFENASVEFDVSTLAPTYRLLWGIPGRSHALVIAERLGLDTAILERAGARLGGEVREVDSVIAGLEAQRQAQDAKLSHLHTLQSELERLQDDMAQRAAVMAAKERDLVERQQQALLAAVEAGRSEVAAIIRSLQKGNPTAQEAQQATEALNTIASQAKATAAPKTEFWPEVGDRVRLRGLNQTGEIIAIAQDDYTIRSGILKFTTQRSQLDPLDDHQAKQRQRAVVPPPPPPPPPPAVRTSRNSLDLRGCRVVNALDQVDAFIAAARSGETLWLVHGIGTGKLRAGLREQLAGDKRIAEISDAEQAEGGRGATVIRLR